MFSGFFSKEFYSNTIFDWLLAFVIILLSVVIGKSIYWVMKNKARKWTAKSDSDIDDTLVDIIEEPLVFGVVVFGFWVGLSSLNFSTKFASYVDKAYYVLIILALAWFITRFVDTLIVKYLRPIVKDSKGTLDDQLLPIIRKGLKLTIWAIAILVALNNAGYDIGALLAGVGIGGLAFALAAQDTVSNLFGSFTIFVDKPFMVGDRIKSNGFDGVVTEIGIRSTRIKTLENRIVTIANSQIANSPIENITSEPSRKIVNTIGLTYSMDEKKVSEAVEILKEIVEKNELLEDNSVVGFDSFGDFSLNILFIYYIKKESDIILAKHKTNIKVLEEFNKRGLEMAFPTQTIYSINQN